MRYKGKFYNRFKTVQRPPRVCPLGQGQGPTIGQTIQGQGRGPPVGPSIGQAVQAGPSTNPSVHSGLMHLDIHSHPTNLPMQSPLIQGLSISSPLQGPGHPAISPVQGPSQAVQGLPTNLPIQGSESGSFNWSACPRLFRQSSSPGSLWDHSSTPRPGSPRQSFCSGPVRDL